MIFVIALSFLCHLLVDSGERRNSITEKLIIVSVQNVHAVQECDARDDATCFIAGYLNNKKNFVPGF